jgi:hypothetical protein
MSRTPTVAQIGNILAQLKPAQHSWLDDFEVKAEDQEKTFDAPYDVLACIISALDADVPAWEIGEGWKSIKHVKGFDGLKVTAPNDFQILRANQIRKYYRNKLTILALKSQTMSLFRVDLQELLSMDPTKLKLKFLPMMIRLPSFYKEDTVMDTLKKTTVVPTLNRARHEKESRTLTFVDKIHRKTKNQDLNWYWFVNEQNVLHRLSLDGKNKLNHVFERFLDKPVTIEANYPVSSVRGTDLNFYSVEGDWKLL